MNNVLLVDFGATHIKSVIFSIENDEYAKPAVKNI
jgi:hypothetical protein